jgi:peptidyl-prolyl cis-trans isomerase B (cyclophilin B)
MSQIKRTGESGRGFALAGLVVGYCVVGLSAVAVIMIVLIAILFPFLFLGFFAALRSSTS